MVQREHCEGWGEMRMMWLYLVGNFCHFGQNLNSLSCLFIFFLIEAGFPTLVVPTTERCWSSSVAKLSSGDGSWGPPPYFFFYKKEEQDLSTIVDGLRREVTQPSTHWGQWSFVYFDIYLSSFQEKARSWSWGRMGSCQVRRTKYNIHWLSWHFDSTACSKIGVFFLLGNWILSPLSVTWTVCTVESLFERNSSHVLCIFKWFPQYQGVWDYLRFGTVSFCIYLFLFVKLTHGQFLFPLPEIPNISPDL